jgi:sigma-E factor negative regulatory protein RseA
MNTKEMIREQISAFADGESTDAEGALAALRHPEQKDVWELYHRIGDSLRSDEMAFEMSADFASRLSARFDAEPTVVAPAAAATADKLASLRAVKRWTLPRFAAAVAVATGAFIFTPKLMDTLLDGDKVLAEAPSVTSPVVTQVSVLSATPDGVMLRNPNIDDYLLAHQRFSPSVYSTAQYARPAAVSKK